MFHDMIIGRGQRLPPPTSQTPPPSLVSPGDPRKRQSVGLRHFEINESLETLSLIHMDGNLDPDPRARIKRLFLCKSLRGCLLGPPPFA